MTDRIGALQAAVKDAGLDGWLLYDFRRTNPIAHRVLDIDPRQMFSRRWFYYIPSSGEPTALISAVEPHVLRDLPGQRRVFQTWNELHQYLREALQGAKQVAMEYSPDNAIPVCSKVDAGTVDLVESFGPQVVSSANLAQQFEATLSPARLESHRDAVKRILTARDALLAWLREQLLAGDATLTEYTVQQRFQQLIEQQGLTDTHAPIVALNAHAGDPHYETNKQDALPMRKGDLLLIDFTGRLADRANSVIADYTYMAFLGERVPERPAQLFEIIRQARDAGIDFIRQHVAGRQPLMGYQVDDHVRAIVRDAGYGPNFVHRTGHNIGTETHGSGANLDNLETHDDRLLLPNTICSMEPGIYLPDIGVRTEVNVMILDGGIEVTGVPAQMEIRPLLA